MALNLGDYAPDAKIEYDKAGNTVATTAGQLLMWDTSGDGWISATAATTALGPYAICVSATAAGHTQVKVLTAGYGVVETTGVLEPNDMLQPSTSTAGKVMAYAARTSNIANAMTEWRRACGRYKTDSDTLGTGVIPVDAAANDAVLIHLREVA